MPTKDSVLGVSFLNTTDIQLWRASCSNLCGLVLVCLNHDKRNKRNKGSFTFFTDYLGSSSPVIKRLISQQKRNGRVQESFGLPFSYEVMPMPTLKLRGPQIYLRNNIVIWVLFFPPTSNLFTPSLPIVILMTSQRSHRVCQTSVSRSSVFSFLQALMVQGS